LAHNLNETAMLIATYNVNGINGRLSGLLAWLKEAAPDVACLQELKAPDEKFPEAAIRAAGYGAIWSKKLERRRKTAGVVLANGSMSSSQSGEDKIRKAMVEADVVDCMVCRSSSRRILPSQ
jgi:exonuclease III